MCSFFVIVVVVWILWFQHVVAHDLIQSCNIHDAFEVGADKWNIFVGFSYTSVWNEPIHSVCLSENSCDIRLTELMQSIFIPYWHEFLVLYPRPSTLNPQKSEIIRFWCYFKFDGFSEWIMSCKRVLLFRVEKLGFGINVVNFICFFFTFNNSTNLRRYNDSPMAYLFLVLHAAQQHFP